MSHCADAGDVTSLIPTHLVSPRCPPFNLNPRTVYKHMDAVTMWCVCDRDPANILESDKVTFFTLNYIITQSSSVNWTLSDSFRGMGASEL